MYAVLRLGTPLYSLILPSMANKKARFDPEVAIHKLPYEAEEWAKLKFAQFANGEVGLARVYSDEFRDLVVAAVIGPEQHVFKFDSTTALWKPQDFKRWRLEVGRYLEEEAGQLCEYLRIQHAEEEEVDPKGTGTKVWKAVLGKAMAATLRVTQERTLTSIAKLAFEELRDDSFRERLNARRDIISVRNGILRLRALTVRPRRRDDFLTYALPYDFDPEAEGASPDRMVSFVKTIYDDDADAARALQTLCGYWATGQVNVKAFWQAWAPSGSGKTTFVQLLMAAMGAYFTQDVTIANLVQGSNFEDDFAAVFSRVLPVRCIFFDETDRAITVNQKVLNGLTDGKEVQAQRFRMKGKGSMGLGVGHYHSKIALWSNNAALFPVGSDGTAYRCRGIGFTKTFVGPDASPIADPTLVPSLETPEARAGILHWIAQGAQRFYAEGPTTLMCTRFEKDGFKLQVASSPYLTWLVEEYFPTGDVADRHPLDPLVAEFIASKRFPAAARNAHDGIQAALESCTPYIQAARWGIQDHWAAAEVEVRGFTGFRKRRHGDPLWFQAREAARAKRAAVPEAGDPV